MGRTPRPDAVAGSGGDTGRGRSGDRPVAAAGARLALPAAPCSPHTLPEEDVMTTREDRGGVRLTRGCAVPDMTRGEREGERTGGAGTRTGEGEYCCGGVCERGGAVSV